MKCDACVILARAQGSVVGMIVIHLRESNLLILLSKRIVQPFRSFTLSALYGFMPVGGDKSVSFCVF